MQTNKTIIGALPNEDTTLMHGKFTIKKALGQGATGITYQANMKYKVAGELGGFDSNTDVAIKEFFFKGECYREPTTNNVLIINKNVEPMVAQYKKQFVKEAKELSRLSHPNIVPVSHYFEENNTAYYVMQFISGGAIKDMLDQCQGPIPVGRAIKYAKQIASAVKYMHDKNMCHYDIKPGNIMISDKDDAMLIDFGIAKHYDNQGHETSTTPPGLTKGFAPLEQYSSVTEFSPKIDVYSLGATLYAMLTGVTPPEPTKWVNSGFPDKPDYVPVNVWDIVKSAMKAKANERPSMAEMYSLLERIEKNISGESDSKVHEDPGPDTGYEPDGHTEPNGSDGNTIYDTAPGSSITAEDFHFPNSQTTWANNHTKKKSKYRDWLFYTLLVLVGALAGFCSFYFISTADNSSPTAIADSVSTIYDTRGKPIMTFTGKMNEGVPNGKGVLTYLCDSLKDRYEGSLKKGMRHDSQALLYFKNGDYYEGAFEDDHFLVGAYHVKESGEYFKGKFKNDEPWNGVWYDPQDNVISRVEKGNEK